ncbi:MAG TPA: hypothetical protein EYO70_02445, partial [Candidatus Marinimicrobia bacterium]|nr:hypothetical protein [Candidatus Neomarinimicrobiota bacterium]
MKSVNLIETDNSEFHYSPMKLLSLMVAVLCLSFPLKAQWTKINIETFDQNWRAISSVDLDGDNDLDILTLGRRTDLRLDWFKNDGKENFESNVITNLELPATAPAHLIGGDLDHDGDNDVIFIANKLGLYWFENTDGNGTFSDTINIGPTTTNNVQLPLFSIDIDGDEDIDILSKFGTDIVFYENNCKQNSSCWSGSEKPQFTKKTVGEGLYSIDVVDADGDGDLDVLTIGTNESYPSWHKSNASESPASLSFTQYNLMSSINDGRSAAWGDMDGDLDMDIVACSYADHKISWYENDGSENFSEIIIPNDPEVLSKNPFDITVKDFNGDGHLDIVVGNVFSPNIIYYNDGNSDPTFNGKIIAAAPYLFTYMIDASDLDQDGTMDIIYANQRGGSLHGGVGWYNNNRRIHVSTAGSDESGNGSEASPYETIQHAINISHSSDTVLVAEGTYAENINFRGKDIVVASKTLTTDDPTTMKSYVAQTIIDGSSPSNSDSASVVTFVGEETSAALLLGFTIQNGTGTNITIDGANKSVGGGIYLYKSSPTLKHLDIKDNDSDHGGGIFFDYNSDASLAFSTVRNNQAVTDGGGICVYSLSDVTLDSILIKDNSSVNGGGYAHPKPSNTELKNVRVISNIANTNGGGMYIGGGGWNDSKHYNILVSGNSAGSAGGGIYLTHAKNRSQFFDSIISNNSSGFEGGGLFVKDADPIFERTIFRQNLGVKGGGIYVNSPHVVMKLINTLIYDNTATQFGGGIHAYNNVNLKFFHSTIFNNQCDCGDEDSGIYAHHGIKIYFYNSIFWAGSGLEKVKLNGSAAGRFEARNSIIKGLASIEPSNTNDVIDIDETSFDTNPYFSDLGSIDLTLKNYSPAIGYGSANKSLTPDDIDSTAVNLDLNSASRPSGNDPDIGAYENSLNSPANAPPLIDAISDLTITEDSDETTVNLSGIADGDYHSSQTISLTASSADASKIPDPTVTYTSAEATASITFTPATNANGNVILSVQLSDNGGTDNGGLDTRIANINVSITAVNDPPSITASTISTPENVALVGDIEASDPEGNSISYSIVGGNDSEKFTLTSEGALSFKDAPNYESPSDLDVNNEYEISVETSDGSLAETTSMTITVTDADDGPLATNEISEVEVNEDASDHTIDISAVFTDEDGDEITKTIASNSNTDLLSASISANSLILDFKDNKYGSATLTIQGEANGKTATESFGVNVKGVNDPPSIATADTVTASENQTTVITITASDPDPDNKGFSYSLTGGDDESKFSITNAGVLTFKEAKDKESPDDNNGDGTYLATIQVEDDLSTTGSKTVAVTLTSVNEAPSNITLSSRIIDDNSASGTLVGKLSASDVDAGDSHSYSLVAGDGSTDNSNFTISGDSLKAATTMDAESKKTHFIRIKVIDSGSLSYGKSFTIIVKGVNDNIPIITANQSFTISEASALGSNVGTVLATDADAGDTIQDWKVESGNDEGFFTIGSSTGIIITSKILNYETRANYKLTVTASDGVYISDIDTVSITVSDVSEGVTVTRNSGLVTTEAAGQDTFSIFLNSAPLHNVKLPLESSDLTEGTVSPDTLTFTSTNWATGQKVTVTGVDDTDDVVNVDYTVRVRPTVSTDPNYDGINPEDVSVTNLDDEKGGFLIEPAGGLITSENGRSDVFKVALQVKPTHSVTIPISSSDTTEAMLEASEIVITLLNWSTPQEIAVTGIDDDVSDGNVSYSIKLGAAVSEDAAYNGKDPTDISGTNIDNDIKNIRLYPLEGIFTSEDGTRAFFNVRLQAAPLSDVKIPFRSADTSEVTISPDTLIFSTDNWEGIRKVQVMGKPDSIPDADKMIRIISDPAISNDPAYNNFDTPDPNVHNLNVDAPGVSVSPIFGLNVSEGGQNCTFSLVLLSKPEANVTIGLSSSDVTEATLEQPSVVFTPDNWDVPQSVTVLGQDDAVIDGDQTFSVITDPTVSDDSSYNKVDPSDLILKNVDDEGAGFIISPLSGLSVSEDGTTAETSFQLRTHPASPVTLLLATANDEEGTVAPTSISFNSSNWSESQTVTITGVDDNIKDGRKGLVIVTFPAESEDPHYKDADPVDIIVFNEDNDDALLIVSPSNGLETTEKGGQANFSLTLSAEPLDDVVIFLSSSDETEGTVDPPVARFIASEWMTSIEATVTGVDDNEADGDQQFTIITSEITSGDPVYNNMDPSDVLVVNIDFEPRIVLSDTSFNLVGIETDTTTFAYLEIHNTGNDSLLLTDIQITGDIFSVNTSSMITAPGDTNFLEIIINPGQNIGTYWGNLSFTHNDPRLDMINIPLKAVVILFDNTGPDIVISENEPISENTPLKVTASITDKNSVMDPTLWYRIGGETRPEDVSMDLEDTLNSYYSATIPGKDITWKGVSFDIEAKDERNNKSRSDLKSVNISFTHGQVSTQLKGSAFTQGMPGNLWRMISIPAEVDENTVEEVFENELGKLKVKNWTIWEWTGATKNDGYEEPRVLLPGKAYWLIQHVKSTVDFQLGSGLSIDQSGWTFTFLPGWNLIGNPYPFESSLELNDSLFYGPVTYGWGGEGWSEESTLRPWGGYAVYNRSSTSEMITLRPAITSWILSRQKKPEPDG